MTRLRTLIDAPKTKIVMAERAESVRSARPGSSGYSSKSVIKDHSKKAQSPQAPPRQRRNPGAHVPTVDEEPDVDAEDEAEWGNATWNEEAPWENDGE